MVAVDRFAAGRHRLTFHKKYRNFCRRLELKKRAGERRQPVLSEGDGVGLICTARPVKRKDSPLSWFGLTLPAFPLL
jgi:hypothetical protein